VYPRLIAVDDGESAHPSVAAASILAKVARDEALAQVLDKYAPEFGTITGGGYPNPATQRFLDAYRARYGALPVEARKSWGAKR
jgi:ribonuclease HII